jgi:hypothetical protein
MQTITEPLAHAIDSIQLHHRSELLIKAANRVGQVPCGGFAYEVEMREDAAEIDRLTARIQEITEKWQFSRSVSPQVEVEYPRFWR